MIRKLDEAYFRLGTWIAKCHGWHVKFTRAGTWPDQDCAVKSGSVLISNKSRAKRRTLTPPCYLPYDFHDPVLSSPPSLSFITISWTCVSPPIANRATRRARLLEYRSPPVKGFDQPQELKFSR